MADIPEPYPFDPTGLKASNRITGEKHALSPPAWKDYHFIIPKLAPFFRESLVITELNTGRTLIEGVDWLATHRFIGASRSVAKPVYGSITFYDKTFCGVIEIGYQTLGGDWTLEDGLITQLLTQVAINPRITTWEDVVDLPFQFPVIDHQWHLDDLVGMSEVKTALEGIGQCILDTNDIRPVLSLHLANLSNPHQVTKTQVGLGVVENFPIATRAEALDGVADAAYMTPRRVRQAIERVAYEYTDQHAANSENPHQVSSTQVGLGAVQNFSIATVGEAQEGDRHDKYMTPLRVKDAISAQVTNRLTVHTADLDNPHQVTKSQVGLSAVQNYPPATVSEAETGMRDDRYMSPIRVRQAIERFGYSYTNAAVEEQGKIYFYTKEEVRELIQIAIRDALGQYSDLTNHLTEVNPHGVTASSLGLGALANLTPYTLETVLLNTETAVTVLKETQAELLEDFTEHLALTNPHQLTALYLGLPTQPPASLEAVTTTVLQQLAIF